MCDKTCIFFFFPIINKYFLMAKRSLLSRCPSYFEKTLKYLMVCYLTATDLYTFQNFLLRVASHPILSFDRLFIGFLQLDEGWRDSIKDTGKTSELFGSLETIILNLGIKVKVKVTLVQALRLCTGRMAHRGSRGIALPFLDHGTRRG